MRYEWLPEICSNCGIIGHFSRDCAFLLRSDHGFNYPPQYGDWLQFSGKGMLITPISLRENDNVTDREIPQSQRLAIEVSPASIPAPTVNELPCPRHGRIRINEHVNNQEQRPQAPLSSAYYSLFGNLNGNSKGKEKVVEVATK